MLPPHCVPSSPSSSPSPPHCLPQAAGARVIPIFFDMTPDQIRRIFGVINGVLIPGGGANLTPGHQ